VDALPGTNGTDLKPPLASPMYPVVDMIPAVSQGPLADRFALKSQAGSGGMGTVYKAFDLHTQLWVAVKVLTRHNETDLARFEQEVTLLSELRHTAIVRFIDHGTTAQGQRFLVMEWLEGETLEATLRRTRLGQSQTVRLAARVCEGLAVAHNHGFVHRDIKPSNVFLCHDLVSNAKLLDFGVARKTLDPKRFTRAGSTVGTPMYTSPEQARGWGDVDGRADLFSLACVLFEALTGFAAFAGDSPDIVMTKICSGPAPRLQDYLPDVHPGFTQLLAQMFSRARDDRPSDAAAVAKAFAELHRDIRQEEIDSGADLRYAARKVSARSQTRNPRRSQTLSQTEQRIMTVLVVAVSDEPSSEPRASGPGARRTAVDEPTFQWLCKTVQSHGGQVDRLIDHTAIVTVAGFGNVDEQAFQIASMALAVQSGAAEFLSEAAPGCPALLLGVATGRGIRLAGLPAGEVVEKASRLFECSGPGAIAVDASTRFMLDTRFRFRTSQSLPGDLGAPELMGRLSAERPRRATPAGGHWRSTPFVGRTRELKRLQGVFAECESERRPAVVALCGPAGVGKSRLVGCFTDALAGQVRPPTVLRVRCRRQHARSGLEIFDRLVGSQLALTGDVEQISHVLGRHLFALCETGPVVFIVEDAHQADAAALSVIRNCVRNLPGCRLLFLVVVRAGVSEAITQRWVLSGDGPEQVRLAPLPARHAEEIAQHCLPQAPPETRAWILARGAGNPAFVEELCWFRGQSDQAVLPERIAGLVQGQLDVVAENDRRILRAVSVFEEPASVQAIASLVSDVALSDLQISLDVLVESGWLLAESDETPACQLRYRFLGPLWREAVSMTLLPKDRSLGRALARDFLRAEGLGMPQWLQPGNTTADLPTMCVPILSTRGAVF